MRLKLLICTGVVGCAMLTYAVAHGVTLQLLRGERTAPSSRESDLALEIGDRLCVPGKGSLSMGARTIVVVDDQHCPACEANEPFEEQLYSRSRQLHIPVVYLIPSRKDQDDNEADLRSLGRNVVRTDLSKVGLSFKPTILAVDQLGIIEAMAIGSVPEKLQPLFAEQLTSGYGNTAYGRIEESDLEATVRKEPTYQLLTLVAPAKPPFPGAHYTYIPFRDLSIRAKYELDRETPTFVDCGIAGTVPAICQMAAIGLTKGHFNRVIAVGLPRRPTSVHCPE